MRCGVTGKIIFKTHAGALNRGGEILTGDSNRKFTPKSFRAYQCEYCGFFHLTGKRFVDRSQKEYA